MSTDDDTPLYACRCLNIRLHSSKDSDEGAQSHSQQGASAEYVPLFVGDEGIKISHNELTLRIRARVVTDSTSATGRTQQTVVTCLVCDTAAYRVKAEVPPDEDAKEGPILPTEDWAERDTLRSKSGYVDVHVGKDGCIAHEEIRRVLSSSSYSQYFSLALPPDSHILSTTAPPLLPQARLTVSPSHSFLPSLPPFLPPPPFTPSHPIFLHLSSVVTANANDARRDTEKRIEDFARQELARLEEHETNLRKQLERIWWVVKEAIKKAEQERDASLLLALRSRRRSMSPHRPPVSADEVGSMVIRNFVPSATYHTPRATHSSADRRSALSASLATTSFHHPRAQQETRSDTDDVRGRPAPLPPLTPSPPPYTSNPSSSRSGSESPTGSVAIGSRSFKRNIDESNDAAVTYRYFVIEEQEAARRKAKEQAKKNRDNEVIQEKKDVPNPGSEKRAPTSESKAEGKKEPVAAANEKVTNPKKKNGRRKVTFNIQPSVVTIKRDITAEEEEERPPEKGEDLLFDMDGIDAPPVEHEVRVTSDDVQGAENVQRDKTETVLREPVDREQKSSRRAEELKDAGLPQSFAALRPSSLPAPSHIRPPLRSQTRSDEEVEQFGAQQASSISSQPKDIKRQSSDGDTTGGVLSPEQQDFLKLVAAETPSHRGLWKPGSDAWKIFDRRASSSGKQSSAAREDDADEPSTDANGTDEDSTVSDWRHYKRPDIVGSLPIPMAPISQQRPSGALSLRPKTSLTDRPGTLVPPLPALAPVAEEEEEVNDKRPAASIRKKVYAERNKARGLDPGILDFTDDGDEDEGETLEREDSVNDVSTSRSRQHALKIIRSRNSVPPEGL